MAKNYQVKAREAVRDYFNDRVDKSDRPDDEDGMLDLDDVYVVWFSKTLQNWKALVSTELADNMYYEVTYNGDGKVMYLDVYKKFENLEIPDPS